MASRLIIMILFALNSQVLSAQDSSPYSVIRALSSEMNSKFPILDSLYPVKSYDLSSKDYSYLSKKEKKEIKRVLKKQLGYSLREDSLQDRILIAASPIFHAFKDFDSTASILIEKTQPFFMISNPVFFARQRKAIINVSLIRGYGYTYILEKTGEEWKIVKSIYGWM